MGFNSFQFLIFLPAVLILYFSIPFRFRWMFLLASSYYFYMCWKPEYVILIIISTLIDYYAGLQMGKTNQKAKRKKFLILSLCSNLGILFGFKYFNFFSSELHNALNHLNIFYDEPVFNILLPVGISFYTFQTLSYTIDVYRGNKTPEKHLGIFALYVAFFPQLVAGPIERSTSLLPQFRQRHSFDYERTCSGLKLILWGYFKKVVVADRLGATVNMVYGNPSGFHGPVLLIATYFFAFQIYCDFSGYSDIAIGVSRIMGYRLMENFKRPYFAQSLTDFWKRWHISLTTWFKDYLYIPLGGNRVNTLLWCSNIFIVFLLSGLWHGAKWTFLVWGGIHGVALLISRFVKKPLAALYKLPFLHAIPIFVRKAIHIVVTFHIIIFAWIFFRANSLSDAFIIIRNMFHKSSHVFALDHPDMIFKLSVITFLLLSECAQSKIDLGKMFKTFPIYIRWNLYYVFMIFIVLFGEFNSLQFIYFQF